MADGFRVYFADVRRMVAQILGIRYMIPGELEREVRGVADDSELIFQAYALRKTGRLARGIRSIVSGKVAIVMARAVDPQTGFDYVAVTRFGHRQARIRPRSDRAPASVVATGGERATGGRAALRFTLNGRVMYRKSTRGFRPRGDWADKAMPQIQQVAEDASRDLGRKIMVAWGNR